MKALLILSLFVLSILANEDYYYAFGKKVTVTKLNESRTLNDTNITYYQTQTGHKVGVRHDIIIRCKDGVDCIPTVQKYDIVSVEKLSEKLYLINLPTDTNPFEMANNFHQEVDIVFAHPNFIKQRQSR